MSEEDRPGGRPSAYRGVIDTATTQIVSGWALNRERPEETLDLDVYLGQRKVGSVRADQHRPDLERLGVAGGRYGFLFRFPTELSPEAVSEINVRTADGARLVPQHGNRFRAHIDRFTGHELRGWALNTLMAGCSLNLDILVDGSKVCDVVADRMRPDLVERFGSGNHGFLVSLPAEARSRRDPHIQVRDAESGTVIAEVGHSSLTSQAAIPAVREGSASGQAVALPPGGSVAEPSRSPDRMTRWIAPPIVHEPSTSPRRPAVFGLAAILLFFGGFGTWAATFPLDRAVIANGVIAVEGNRRDVQHLEGGIVKEVLVRNGERVAKGDVLVRLDRTAVKANVEALSGRLVALLAREARLQAERVGAEEIEWPDLLQTALSPENAHFLQQELNIFNTRRQTYEGEKQLLRQRAEELKIQIEGYAAQKQAQERQLRLIKDELAGLEGLYEKGYVTRPRILSLKRERASLEGLGGELVSNMAETREAIAQIESQIAQLTRERSEQIADELREVSAELTTVRPELRKFRETLERVEIRAPASGYVLGMTTLAPGRVIKPGETLFQIVPSTANLVVEAKAPTTEVESLHPGLPARIRLTGYPVRTTPTLEGELTYVSADFLIDERTGDRYFELKVDILREGVKLPDGIELMPGMPAETAVLTQARTALDYLMSPLLRSAERAGREQ